MNLLSFCNDPIDRLRCRSCRVPEAISAAAAALAAGGRADAHGVGFRIERGLWSKAVEQEIIMEYHGISRFYNDRPEEELL